MSILPWWAKALIVAAALAALGYGVHCYNQSIRDDQRALDVAEFNVKLMAAQEDARAQERAWKAQQKKAQEEVNEQLKARDAKYAALAATANSLRIAATNYGNGLATDTITSCRARAATLSDVFGQCSEALRDMAKAADGQYIDSVNCRNQWPVSVSP